MTSWAAGGGGDPFDAVRKFFADMQDWWGQPRGGQWSQSERSTGGAADDRSDGPREDRFEQSDSQAQHHPGPPPGGAGRQGPPPGGPFGPGLQAPWAGGWGGRRPGGPFGPFGPFGGPGRWGGPGGPGKGPWGGRNRGPRAGRGDVRLAILALLAEEPMHGYQVIQEISRRSAGAWKPSPGSVYPTLQQLEDEGLVHAEERDGKRVYSLTADGRTFADERAHEFATMWDAYQPDDNDAALGDLVFGVASAFVHVMRTGTDRQIAAARAVLARTRADLYKILGDDQEPHSAPGDNGGQSDNDAATDPVARDDDEGPVEDDGPADHDGSADHDGDGSGERS